MANQIIQIQDQYLERVHTKSQKFFKKKLPPDRQLDQEGASKK